MRTDFERETRPETADKAGSKSWIGGVVLAVVVVLLAIWAINANHGNKNSQAPGATSSSVQNSATGEQGSVGQFREQVVPNTQGNQETGAPGAANGLPAGGYTQPQATGSTQQQTNEGSEAGAGSTGITTSTDTIGGAPVKSSKGSTENGNDKSAPGRTNGTNTSGQ
ncbi:MAG TPA: hypothetical protein V6D22_12710 [Candidatus Obscuribacterales bacterium]